MSVKISSMVWEACLRPEQKYILLALADQANDDGYCVYRKSQEITISVLAQKTGMSERTIQRQIAELLNAGLLEITRAASHHSPHEYRIRGDNLSSLNTIIRGDKMTPLTLVDKSIQRGQNVTPEGQPGVTFETVRGDIHDSLGCHSRQSGVTPCHPIYKVLDVDSRNYTLSHVLSERERETCIKDLKRIFPALLSIPDEIPIERVYLFLHKVKNGEIKRENIYSPVAYISKMLDEDISAPLAKDRERKARAAG